jgi:SOS response regulatory protein OraA/RecX
MDYIDKNLLRKLRTYEDVSLMAACVLRIKNWTKILRSKEQTLTHELIQKGIDYAVPASFISEKSANYWMEKIRKDYDRHNLKEMTLEEELKVKFLQIIS